MSIPLGPNSVRTKCPQCHADIATKVKSIPTKQTHIIALIMCLFCFWPLAWIPYFKDSCQDRVHYCPNCNAYLGVFNLK